jgi:subtilisin
MAIKRKRAAAKGTQSVRSSADAAHVSTDTETLLLAALERGGDASQTGRYLVTFREGASEAAIKQLQSTSGLRVAHAKDFKDQAILLEATGDADAVVFPDIHVALIGGPAAEQHSFTTATALSADDPFYSIDPEYFVFATGINAADYMKGVLHTAQMIARDLGIKEEDLAAELVPQVAGATWGLIACNVPPSARDGNGIKVAVLDTGFDLGHPEFAGRSFTTQTFVGQPVQDLNGHGTHTTGTACGPNAPPGSVPRYGIAFKSQIFTGKVLTNSGSGTQAQSLAGIN